MTANLAGQERSPRESEQRREFVASITVNAAFFREIKDDNVEMQTLLETIKGLLSVHTSLQHRVLLVSLICDLRDQLAMHFALEEAYGYFSDPITVAPELSCFADLLRSEHATLYARISEIAEHAEYVVYDRTCKRLWPQVIQQVATFCDHLLQHENREVDLIQRAYNDELGGGD